MVHLSYLGRGLIMMHVTPTQMAHPYQRAIFDLREFSKIQSHIVLN